MELSINIDRNTCIKCGKCIKICPSGIFYRKANDNEPFAQHVETCIGCGHCCGICPTFSVIHNLFPPQKVHQIRPELLPTPEQIGELIRSRRSNRAFSKVPIPDEYLDMILEAAHRAPTASNMQQVSFTLVTDPAMLKAVIDRSMGIFGKMADKLSNPLLRPFINRIVPGAARMLPMFRRLQARHKEGGDPILRGATALILIHAPKNNRFGAADCNLAYQNGSLMAESLGVAQFYTGFLCTAFARDKQHELAGMLSIDGYVHAGMALAMPQFRFPNYIDKKDIQVSYFL